jgi:hypothetical protein
VNGRLDRGCSRVFTAVIPDTIQLAHARCADKQVYSGEGVVDWGDDEGVSDLPGLTQLSAGETRREERKEEKRKQRLERDAEMREDHDPLTQITPVAARARFWLMDSLSAGRLRSLMPAITRAHLHMGAQKKIVLFVSC